MQDDPTLRFYINQLYEVFSVYKNWNRENICSDCLTQDDLEVLASKNLEDLSEIDLQEFARSVLLTVGNRDDFRHFLPRMFELSTLVAEPSAWPYSDLVGRLEFAEWRSWPKKEQEAIEKFLRAWWEATISSYPSQVAVSTILRALAEIYSDLIPFLNYWLDCDSMNAYLQYLDNLWVLEDKDSSFGDMHIAQFQSWLTERKTEEWVANCQRKFSDGYWISSAV
jgi:hypothetical protein